MKATGPDAPTACRAAPGTSEVDETAPRGHESWQARFTEHQMHRRQQLTEFRLHALRLHRRG